MAKMTITLTEAQQRALIWAVNIWEANMEGYEYETDKEMATKIRAARVALNNVYDQLDPVEEWLPKLLENAGVSS